jgi:hypothetical protein
MSEKYEVHNSEMPMTNEEIMAFQTKLGKSHKNQKDWELLENVFEGKMMYTAKPTQLRQQRKYSTDGILTHGGALLVFTSEVSCAKYLARVGIANDKYMSIREIPYDSVRETAKKHQKMAFIDLNEPVGQRIAGIDGKNGVFRVFAVSK